MALRLFLASGAAFIAALLWGLIKNHEWERAADTTASTVRKLSVGGMIIAAGWAAADSIRESNFWKVVLGTFVVLTFFALLLPVHFTFFEQHAPHRYIVYILPLALGYVVSYYRQGGINKLFSFIILCMVIISFVEMLSAGSYLRGWIDSITTRVQGAASAPPARYEANTSATTPTTRPPDATPLPARPGTQGSTSEKRKIETEVQVWNPFRHMGIDPERGSQEIACSRMGFTNCNGRPIEEVCPGVWLYDGSKIRKMSHGDSLIAHNFEQQLGTSRKAYICFLPEGEYFGRYERDVDPSKGSGSYISGFLSELRYSRI